MKHNNTEVYRIKKHPVLSDFVLSSDSEKNKESINIELSSILSLIQQSQEDSDSYSSLRYRFSSVKHHPKPCSKR